MGPPRPRGFHSKLTAPAICPAANPKTLAGASAHFTAPKHQPCCGRPARRETEFCRERPAAETRRNARAWPQESSRRPKPRPVTHGNLGLIDLRGNHRRSRGLPGGAGGIRTPDLCSAIAALSHLSYSPSAPLFTRAAPPAQDHCAKGNSRLSRPAERLASPAQAG